jgi:hypothetical protein
MDYYWVFIIMVYLFLCNYFRLNVVPICNFRLNVVLNGVLSTNYAMYVFILCSYILNGVLPV